MTDPFALHHEGLVQVHRALGGAFSTVIAAPNLLTIVPAARRAGGFLGGHHRMESEGLFVGLRKRGRLRSTDVGFLDACDRQHHQLHVLNERMLAAANAPHPAMIAIVSLARDIAAHLAVHTKEEEAGLAPERICEMISVEEFLEVGHEIEALRQRETSAA